MTGQRGVRISSYIMRQLVISAIIVVVVLTCIIWLSRSLRFVEIIVNHGLPLSTLAHLTLLMLPSWLSIVLPITAFAAVLYTYHRMTGDREIIVLEATGVSPIRLARPAILIACLVTALGYLMTLYLIPVSFTAFKDLQFEIRHHYPDITLREGVFNSMADDRVMVYVRERQPNGELHGMIVHDTRDRRENIVLIAESGSLVMSESGPIVFMQHGSRQSWDTVTDQFNLLGFSAYRVNLSVSPSLAARVWNDENAYFVSDLLNPSPAITSPANYSKFIAEGHRRLSLPLLGLTLPLMALTVLLRNAFSRRGLTARVVVTVALAILLQCGVFAIKGMVIQHPWLIPAMYVMVLAPGAVALLLLVLPGFGWTVSRASVMTGPLQAN